MIQVNRIYLIFNRLVTKKFLVDTSDNRYFLMLLSLFVSFTLQITTGKLERFGNNQR